jgi:predicted DCC family thiol-disulfide oxidoreductase YuxK
MTRPVIVFDAMCVLCSGHAQFVLRHDRAGQFLLASMQSEAGAAIYRSFGIDPADPDTLILVEGDRALRDSDAILAIWRGLGWPWRIAGLLGSCRARCAIRCIAGWRGIATGCSGGARPAGCRARHSGAGSCEPHPRHRRLWRVRRAADAAAARGRARSGGRRAQRGKRRGILRGAGELRGSGRRSHQRDRHGDGAGPSRSGDRRGGAVPGLRPYRARSLYRDAHSLSRPCRCARVRHRDRRARQGSDGGRDRGDRRRVERAGAVGRGGAEAGRGDGRNRAGRDHDQRVQSSGGRRIGGARDPELCRQAAAAVARAALGRRPWLAGTAARAFRSARPAGAAALGGAGRCAGARSAAGNAARAAGGEFSCRHRARLPDAGAMAGELAGALGVDPVARGCGGLADSASAVDAECRERSFGDVGRFARWASRAPLDPGCQPRRRAGDPDLRRGDSRRGDIGGPDCARRPRCRRAVDARPVRAAVRAARDAPRDARAGSHPPLRACDGQAFRPAAAGGPRDARSERRWRRGRRGACDSRQPSARAVDREHHALPARGRLSAPRRLFGARRQGALDARFRRASLHQRAFASGERRRRALRPVAVRVRSACG